MRTVPNQRQAGVGEETLRLIRFLPHHASTVAGWVLDDLELFWVAPSTCSPLTPEKVLAWTHAGGHPYLLWCEREQAPIGYAELNPLRRLKNRLWIGHVILSPPWRGWGMGVAFIRLLLRRAFDLLAADHVSLIVFPDNRQAIHCYLKAGFNRRDEQVHKFGRPPRSHRMLHLVASRPPRGLAP